MRDLTILNKWWKNKNRIEEDKHIKEFNDKQYQWKPKLLELDPKINNVYTIRGPRQIGKTTLIKLIIKRLLETVEGEAIFYWSCDDVIDFKELLALLRKYLNLVELMCQDLCKTPSLERELAIFGDLSQ